MQYAVRGIHIDSKKHSVHYRFLVKIEVSSDDRFNEIATVQFICEWSFFSAMFFIRIDRRLRKGNVSMSFHENVDRNQFWSIKFNGRKYSIETLLKKTFVQNKSVKTNYSHSSISFSSRKSTDWSRSYSTNFIELQKMFGRIFDEMLKCSKLIAENSWLS